MNSFKEVMSIFLILLGFCSFITTQQSNSGSITSKEISLNMPNLNKRLPSSINFKQYSGYAQIANSDRNLFYWFIESSNNPTQDPIILWLNGGPGVSSLKGLFQGNGPWQPNPKDGGKTIDYCETSWNTFSNIIFLDSPVFAGFSYSTNQTDYNLNTDERTAEDSYKFLELFFQKYPNFKTNPFYLAGQSYGGHYIPNLAKKIVEKNKLLTTDKQLNFKGFVVGNPLIDWKMNTEIALDMYQLYGLVSKKVVENTIKTCNMTTDDDWVTKALNDMTGPCVQSLGGAVGKVGTEIDNYNIFGDKCIENSPYYYTKSCSHIHIGKYLNDKIVQNFINVKTDISNNWVHHNTKLSALYSRDQYGSSSNAFEYLFNETLNNSNKYKYLIYTGDVDSNTGYLTAIRLFEKKKWEIIKDMESWFVNNQVGGRQYQFKGFTYSTVRGAGHLCPLTQPIRTYIMVNNFIKNGTIPKQNTYTITSNSNIQNKINLLLIVILFIVSSIFILKF